MVSRFILGLSAGLSLLAVTPAVAGDRLGTLPQGRYLCELPGDASGLASRPVDSAWFDIVNASSYASEGGPGTYLLTGKTVMFTRGPLKGAEFRRTGARALKRTDLSGELANLRCIRSGRAE